MVDAYELVPERLRDMIVNYFGEDVQVFFEFSINYLGNIVEDTDDDINNDINNYIQFLTMIGYQLLPNRCGDMPVNDIMLASIMYGMTEVLYHDKMKKQIKDVEVYREITASGFYKVGYIKDVILPAVDFTFGEDGIVDRALDIIDVIDISDPNDEKYNSYADLIYKTDAYNHHVNELTKILKDRR